MPTLRNLVISSGGINGLGFLGIIKYLFENNLIILGLFPMNW